ncbi:MAG: hypothetical protein ABIQ44_12510, partial [Chloroflexia bacterium]
MENNGNGSLVAHLLSQQNKTTPGQRNHLGQVTAADTERGVTIHLHRDQAVELLRQGQFVVVEGRHVRFFGTINSFRLA